MDNVLKIILLNMLCALLLLKQHLPLASESEEGHHRLTKAGQNSDSEQLVKESCSKKP